MSEVRQFTVAPDDDGVRVDRWFKRHLPDTSFTTVAKWARTGQLRLDARDHILDPRIVQRLATGEAAADVAHALGLAALPSASVRARDADLAASIVDAARKLALPSA